ncbi:hypothetical protein TrCOL_g12555 [Triparma columacea]|nr:hypothetical protein TrCOL_g12555 [Triparma columacea]
MDKDHWFNRGRTKAKIMVSFFQILTSFESVLEIRFPPVFEKFARWLSSTANLDAIQVARADCIIDTNFYSTLLVQTLLPLLVSLLIFIAFIFFKTLFGKTKEKRVAMLFGRQVVKPFRFILEGMFGEHQVHEGSLRGMNEDECRDRPGFVWHFYTVASSTTEEGGWGPYIKLKSDWRHFVQYSNVAVERRCSTGNGPIDEMRMTFNVDCSVDVARKYLWNAERDMREGDIESHDIGGEHSDESRRIFYLAKKLKGFWSDRDMLLEGFMGELEGRGGGWYIARRSIEDEHIYSLKKSHGDSRVRAVVKYEGFLLLPIRGGKTTVVFLQNLDPGGILKGLIVDKKLPKMMRDTVDDLFSMVEENEIDAKFQVFGNGEGGEGVEEGSFEMTNIGGLLRGKSSGVDEDELGGEVKMKAERKAGRAKRDKREKVEVLEKAKNPLRGYHGKRRGIKEKEKGDEEGDNCMPQHATSQAEVVRIQDESEMKRKSSFTSSNTMAAMHGKGGGVEEKEKGHLQAWVKYVEEGTGFEYYENTETGETTWEMPEDYRPPPESQQKPHALKLEAGDDGLLQVTKN